jgi:hypothetical protein
VARQLLEAALKHRQNLALDLAKQVQQLLK